MLTEQSTMRLPSVVSTPRRGPSTVLWGMVIVVLAAPMLLPFAVQWAFMGPDYGVIRTGVVLAELVVILGWAVSARGFFLPRRVNPVVVALGGLWVLASVAATVGAVHPVPAVLRSAEWIAHGLFGFALWSMLQQDRERVPMVQQAIAIGFVVLMGLIVVRALSMQDPAAHNWAMDVPYVSIPSVPNIGNIRYLGVYALAGAIFWSRGLLDPTASRKSRRLALMGLTLGWSVMIWTGGRASAGAGLAAGVAMWWMAGTQRSAFAKSFGFALIAGALLSLCFPVEQGAGGLWRILGYSSFKGPEVDISNGRIMLWKQSLAAWKEQPWLGVGPDGSSFVLAAFKHVQSHNLLVDALLEWGVLGTVPFVGLLGWGLVRAHTAAIAESDASMRASRAVAAAFLFGATANGLLDGLFYDARMLLLIVAAAAMTLLPSGGGAIRRKTVSRRVRLALGGLTLVIAALFTLHIAAVRAVWAPGIPVPGSPRVALLKAFPSPSHLRVTAYWGNTWRQAHPAEALEMTRWGSRHAHLSWFYIRQEADLLRERGLRNEALKRYAQAERVEAKALRYTERR